MVSDFKTPVDIANRALQHIGQPRIVAFTDDSKAASECGFAYDKVRKAELRRNVWRFATRRTVLRPITATTMLLVPPLWGAGSYYQPGQIVSNGTDATGADGTYWVNNTAFNAAEPGTDGTWDLYFGPMTVSLYDSTVSYFPGELVYTIDINQASADIYAALAQGSTKTPNTAPAYDATVTYRRGQTVTYSGTKYVSMIPVNFNNTPASPHALWAAATTYASGAVVVDAVRGNIFTSAQNANTGNPPSVDNGTWWTLASSGVYSQPWLSVTSIIMTDDWVIMTATNAETRMGAYLQDLNLNYPIGVGSSGAAPAANVYRLPHGFLREATQNPKQTGAGFLGGPTHLAATDWAYESDFFVSQEVDPISLRFCADMTDVRHFDPMFCEGLAARLAMEVCEPITQSDAKLAACSQAYGRTMGEARLVNSIETSAVEPPEDEYISVRM